MKKFILLLCAVVPQVGVVRTELPIKGGFIFPCYLSDEEALYRYRHSQLQGQEGWWNHGFDMSTGKED